MATSLVIIQARYGSTRFPGKVLEQLGTSTVLGHVIARVQASGLPLVVATPNTSRDARVWNHARDGLRVPAYMYQGGESDVLGRYAACARQHHADVIVRVTADCPFVDPDIIRLVAGTVEAGLAAYASDTPCPVDGLDVEAFTADLLMAADYHATDPADREHVTPWMRRQGSGVFVCPSGLESVEPQKWSIDTAAELAWCRRACAALGGDPPNPSASDVLAWAEQERKVA